MVAKKKQRAIMLCSSQAGSVGYRMLLPPPLQRCRQLAAAGRPRLGPSEKQQG